MKVKIFLFILVIALIGGTLIFVTTGKKDIVETQNNDAAIQFIKLAHDFGDIKEADGSVEHIFKFVNNSNSVLFINDVKTSCGCTTPDWTKQPVKPGENGFIKAVSDPHNRPGSFNKTLTIVTNSITPQIRLYIKGNVEGILRSPEKEYPVAIGELRMKYKTVSLEIITNEKPVEQVFSVYNDSDDDIAFEPEYKAPNHIKLKFSPQVLSPKTRGSIEVTYDPRSIDRLGIRSDMIEFKTNEWSNSIKEIRILVSLEEYFPPMTAERFAQTPRLKIESPEHDFGSLKQGESVSTTFVISNVGKEALLIRDTRATCGCAVSKPEKSALKPGESSTIDVRFNSAGKSGDQNQVVFVYSNDPSNPTQEIRIKAKVEI